jgi:hypothetical protein
MIGRYHAPFTEQGSHTVDADIADRLLRVALERGGDYADLFFEYSVSGSYVYDEQILKSARRAVSMGLGVRVMKGDATGYAYCSSNQQPSSKWVSVVDRVSLPDVCCRFTDLLTVCVGLRRWRSLCSSGGFSDAFASSASQ